MFIEFSSYYWLFLILLLLGFGGKLLCTLKKKEQHSFLFQTTKNTDISSFVFSFKIGSALLGVLFVLIAFWRPQWGEEFQDVDKKGIDIIFAVDVSKSMNALDFSTQYQLISRLDATKYLIENFIAQQQSDRVGLVEFAGESFVGSPLTLDHNVFLTFLKNISSDDIGMQGTNLAQAIEVSLHRLEVNTTEKRGKAILLFSDGEETISSDAKKMAERAGEKNIPIFTVGVGSEEGMPIPEGKNRFGEIVYKTWQGETVITALNPDPLQEIASITSGEYFHAENIEDLEALSERLQMLPQDIVTEKRISPYSEKYFWFALLGFLFFAMGFLLPSTIFSSNAKK